MPRGASTPFFHRAVVEKNISSNLKFHVKSKRKKKEIKECHYNNNLIYTQLAQKIDPVYLLVVKK